MPTLLLTADFCPCSRRRGKAADLQTKSALPRFWAEFCSAAFGVL